MIEYIDFHTHKPTAEGVITPRSFGIHPWECESEGAKSYEEFAKKYRDAFTHADIIGECGLDKCCKTDWERQREVFEWQTKMAEELRKPMVIHCVRAYNEVMDIRLKTIKKDKAAPQWVVHGFGGGMQMAEQLWKAGILVSFGAALTDNKREKVRNTLRDIELPFMLETDTSQIGIEEIYAEAAKIKNIDIEVLSNTIKENYLSLYNK